MHNQKTEKLAWVLSFSDLLTLLLCFFVSMIASVHKHSLPVGTALATKGVGGEVKATRAKAILAEEHFGSDGVELSEVGTNLLKAKLKEVGTAFLITTVRSCERTGDEESLVSTRQLRALVRQLVDMDVPKREMRVEPLSSCEGLAEVEFLVSRN